MNNWKLSGNARGRATRTGHGHFQTDAVLLQLEEMLVDGNGKDLGCRVWKDATPDDMIQMNTFKLS